MNLIEMIRKFDAVPVKFEFPNGDKFETFTRKKTNNKGYIIAVWRMLGEVQHQMIWSASGDTVAKAQDKLKETILKAYK